MHCAHTCESERAQYLTISWVCFIVGLASPPPLQHLSPDKVWAPGRVQWYVNDQYALIGRRWAEAYFERWGDFMSGAAVEVYTRHFPTNNRLEYLVNGEDLLAATLKYHGARLASFDQAAALLCCPNGEASFNLNCYQVDRFSFKYKDHAQLAVKTARDLATPGHGWCIVDDIAAATTAVECAAKKGVFAPVLHKHTCF